MVWSDSERIRRGLNCKIVGMSEIKRRRLEELMVDCHPGTKVGEYVPFYFCSRSIMLYLLHKGNHLDLSYSGGQGPIVHLEADLPSVVEWANFSGRRWAFSQCNAGARYAKFFKDLSRLSDLNWTSIQATEWKDPFVKESKQAEFLMFHSFPWSMIERIGVIDDSMAEAVGTMLKDAPYKPPVVVQASWYY